MIPHFIDTTKRPFTLISGYGQISNTKRALLSLELLGNAFVSRQDDRG